MKNQIMSLYRKSCVYNFEAVEGRIVGAKSPENRPGGLMVSALPVDEKGNYIPSQKVLFFCGLNDLLQIGNLFRATGEVTVKLYHKPDGDSKNPLSKMLVFSRTSPDAVNISLSQSHKTDDSASIKIPGTTFDKGTLWALEQMCNKALEFATNFDYRNPRG